MKAAVLKELGSLPVYEDFPDPVPANDEQLLVRVKAASIKNLDKARASGKHYASHTNLPAVVGLDGVGLLEDGSMIYGQGLSGMMAEKALVAKGRYVLLPKGIDLATAAALPNAVLGSALALKYRAKIKQGDVVLINGATGVTGRLAVQVARHYGASRVIATGRNAASLQKLTSLGADEIVSLQQEDKAIIGQLKAIHQEHPIDIVMDYLWGHPVTLIIEVLTGATVNHVSYPTRIVTIGSMAGEHIQLYSGSLRSSAIEILGSGLGSFSREEMQSLTSSVLPEMFQLAVDGKLGIETEKGTLQDISSNWERQVNPGKRLVIEI